MADSKVPQTRKEKLVEPYPFLSVMHKIAAIQAPENNAVPVVLLNILEILKFQQEVTNYVKNHLSIQTIY